jgi:hypothetical protein
VVGDRHEVESGVPPRLEDVGMRAAVPPTGEVGRAAIARYSCMYVEIPVIVGVVAELVGRAGLREGEGEEKHEHTSIVDR